MSVKEAVLSELLKKRNTYLSGEELAAALAVSRSAVWKAVGQLRAEGHPIEASTRLGYRLAGGDVLSREGILACLEHSCYDIHVYTSIPSTNTLLKAWAEEGAAEGCVAVAEEQTAGRGRRGRSFYYPKGTGLYLSILLRPDEQAEAALQITTAAAVAAAEAIEQVSGLPCQIKWVNDIYRDGKKLCGILTEASLDVESGGLNYAILGIGINALPPVGGFPPELRDIAGSVYERCDEEHLRCRLAAAFLDRFDEYYRELGSDRCFDAYRSRSLVLGKRVTVFSGGVVKGEAEVLDLERDFSLRVRWDDGLVSRLNSGEVSVHP